MTRFIPLEFYTIPEISEFVLRIAVAGVIGMIIGYARERRHKVVGIRTHFIIAATTALLIILSKYAFVDIGILPGSRGNDNSRMAAQVISGVSFLCAGVIFKQSFSVKGLTTAAGMWATAAIGLAIGSGMYIVGISFFLLVLVIQSLTYNSRRSNMIHEINVSVKALSNCQEKIVEMLKQKNLEVSCIKASKNGDINTFGYIVIGYLVIDDSSLPSIVLENADIVDISITSDV